MTAEILSNTRRSVVLTTDCGADMDDQWALAHLALSPEIRLLGVVTTHAPNLPVPAAETAARVANEVFDVLSLVVRPPVVVGSSSPLARRKPCPNSGVEFVLDQAQSHAPDDRLVVLVIGAATDIASALLTDPSLGERIEVVAMGFEAWPAGRDPFNVRNDALAWHVLMESRMPITVGDASVTLRHLTMTTKQAQDRFGGCKTLGPYLVGLLADWLAAHPDLARQVTGDAGSWPIWDQVVVAHLLAMTTTSTHPRPKLRDDLTFDHATSASETIGWITQIDHARLWLDLQQKLQRACLATPD